MIIAVITGLYCAIILWICYGLLRLKPNRITNGGSGTAVTVVVSVRNEEKNIHKLLTGFSLQDYPSEHTEFIITDDASEDGTLRELKKFADENPHMKIRILEKKIPGKKQAIADAVAAATGEFIITTDADCTHAAGWISSFVKYYEEKRPKLIAGPVRFTDPEGFFQNMQFLEFSGLIASTAGSFGAGYPVMCNGANLAFEKKAFLGTGGYGGNEKYLSGDDQFLMMNIFKRYGRKSIGFNLSREALVLTLPSAGIREFHQQRLRWVSKSRGYRSLFILFVAVVTWLTSASVLTGFAVPRLFPVALMAFLCKMIADFLPVLYMLTFFRKRKLLLLFPVAAVLNLFYVVWTGAVFVQFRPRRSFRKV